MEKMEHLDDTGIVYVGEKDGFKVTDCANPSKRAKQIVQLNEVAHRALDVLEMLEGKPTGNDARVRKLREALAAAGA